MTDAQILKRYAVVTAITMVALIALSIGLSVYAGYDMTAGAGIATVIAPALDAGGNYVRKTGALLDKRRMWVLAMIGMLINLGIGILIFAAVEVVSGEGLVRALSEPGVLFFLMISMPIILGLYMVVGRIFIGFGARQELKRQEKQNR